ncbi:hypothetical protein [Micromonospora parathelypteridis]|uniref:Uncharacterized protein n=1 Tax=Micromonospora parathelypteridis TaxID=1839617 RepID=A0A840VUP1_9ACTN|nr:hypothetical protein [Micromonospora parathelypteridis]MBB5481043.1 hypothetical protein [Micromonospora parathelypteridis]GGO20363.1 hypothetical protein GCM10011576_37560 [Micromonospora parathelypteridis]
MKNVSAYGVGLCPTASGVVFAVVRDAPLRLASVAEVPGGPDNWRGLARARRLLGLPRWCSVSVVTGQFPGPGGATLARARLDLNVTWDAAQMRGDRPWVAPRELLIDDQLTLAMGDEAHRWAVAAALDAVRPADAERCGVAPVGSDGGGGAAEEWDGAVVSTGWAVQRVSRAPEQRG